MNDPSSRVVGYFAYARNRDVICDGGSCVIASTQKAMERYVTELAGASLSDLTIRKTRFGEVMLGLQHGAPYSFDYAAYRRFLPLARRQGLELRKQDPEDERAGLHLVKIQWIGSR